MRVIIEVRSLLPGTGVVTADTIARVEHRVPGFTELLPRDGYLPIEGN